jgi:ComF family protein
MLKGLLDTFFPPLCHGCRVHLANPGDLHFCNSCLEQIRFISSPLCTVCGVPFLSSGDDHTCGSCLTDPPRYTAARSALVFADKVQELVHRFKYDHQVRLRRPLGLLTAGTLTPFITAVSPEILIPVPLHRKRLRWRGYNQAVLLGELLGKVWGIPMQRDNLRRIRWTEPQIELSAAERSANVRGAFAVSEIKSLTGKRVLLVDDVLTTGSTVNECAHTLRKAGVASVHIVTVARAL